LSTRVFIIDIKDFGKNQCDRDSEMSNWANEIKNKKEEEYRKLMWIREEMGLNVKLFRYTSSNT
jgi:hypothetical protein